MIALKTGKTLLAKTLARLVNVPFVIADATTLTQARLYSKFDFHFFSFILLLYIHEIFEIFNRFLQFAGGLCWRRCGIHSVQAPECMPHTCYYIH